MSTPSPIQEHLNALEASRPYGPLVRHHAVLAPNQAQYARLEAPLSAAVQGLCLENGLDRLYSHQVQAIDRLRQGRHTVLATPTASGKSLVFTLPILESFCQDPDKRALLIYPLKALAQDQLRHIQDLYQTWVDRPRAAIYDGDTPKTERTKIRNQPPQLLFTNPDMLHLGLIPFHHQWSKLFSSLDYIVVDEVHTYRGVMGSHMAWVFRRLRRICRYWGSDPTFVFSSATIGNPAELAQKLTGLDVKAISEGTAARGKRHLVFLDAVDGLPRTAIGLLQSALARGLRSIVYTQSRKYTELLSMWLAERNPEFAQLVSAYRSGFLPQERRAIEADLSRGRLLGVISTSALELGIDIGNLDLCILVGYPGSIMAAWQRSGRVGRGNQESATIMLGGEDALDQYFMRNPQAFFDFSPESAVINPDNPVIRKQQLVCAAADLPLQRKESLLQGPGVDQDLAKLEAGGDLLRSAQGDEWLAHRRSPQRQVNLRGAGSSLVILNEKTKEQIGSIDHYRAQHETHPGAVYLHHGQTYIITDLLLEDNLVLAQGQGVDYFTRVRTNKSTRILKAEDSRQVWGSTLHRGRLKVTEKVIGYEKRHCRGQKLLRVHSLDLPPQVFETEGLWLEIPNVVRQELERNYLHFMGGIHALEHALIGILPLVVLADRNDLGGISCPAHEQLDQAAVFVYDGIPGGAGLTRQAFERGQELLELTLATISQCPCEQGCPGCVHSPKCGSGNRPIDKQASLAVLNGIKGLAASSQGPGQSRPQRPRPLPVRAPDKRSSDTRPGYLVFDLETQRSAQEVGGWHRAERMGISCAVVFDSRDQDFHAYQEDQVPGLIEHLKTGELIVGFNILRFDYRVLAGYTRSKLQELPSLDLLQVVHKQLGYRLSLDKLAQATLQAQKSANGLQALKWWQQGRIQEIIDYCRQDVAVTRDLYRYGRDNGYLLFYNKAKRLVRVPVNWD